jgi:hypothetical protein
MFLLLASLVGCKNACQELCVEIAAYADECDLDGWPELQVEACEEKFAKSDDEELLQTCEDEIENLRNEWECEDLEAYFIVEDSEGVPTGDAGGEG